MKKIIILLVCLLMVAVAHAQSYKLIVLDEIGAGESGAYDINNYGFVVGYKVVGANTVPYIWSADRGYLQLPTPPSSTSFGTAYAINDWLEIAGVYGSTGNSQFKVSDNGKATAWVIDQNTNYVAYNIIGDGTTARDINDAGDVAGQITSVGVIQNIYTNDSFGSGQNWSICNSVNNKGNGTGMIAWSPGFIPVFVKKVGMNQYSTVYGVAFSSTAYGLKINDNDQVVGGSSYNGGFLWEPNTGVVKYFGNNTLCRSINNKGQIVGVTGDRAYMWTPQPDSTYKGFDLNRLTGNTNIVLETAMSINEKGQIVGRCLNLQTGVRKAYLLTPAKEVARKLEYRDGNIVLSWPTTLGHNYIVQSSLDLVNWFDYSDVLSAYGTTFEGNVDSSYHHLFFKVIDTTP